VCHISNDTAEVRLVDQGVYVVTPLIRLKEMPKTMKNIEPLAFEASLMVKPTGPGRSDSMKEFVHLNDIYGEHRGLSVHVVDEEVSFGEII
jgi:hypothetical protein